MTLSVAIITLNEEKNLERTLKSVQDFVDEIVIVDSGSTDRTEEIAKKFGAKFVYQKWLGYGPQRNMAIDLSSSDWVLNIDADEEISEELAKKIKAIKENSRAKVYKINFMLHFFQNTCTSWAYIWMIVIMSNFLIVFPASFTFFSRRFFHTYTYSFDFTFC